MLALAENFSGRLLDESCYDKQKTAAGCDATSKTTSFSLDANGAVYKLDRAGNSKAATAIKSRADRSDPAKPQTTPAEVTAKVTGTQKDG